MSEALMEGEGAPVNAGQARRLRLRLGWKIFASSPAAMAGLAIVLLLVLCAALAPWIAGAGPYVQHLGQTFRPPSSAHWFGTDEFGRDLFSRIVYGTRITLLIVLLVAIVAAPIGLAIGCVAGYLGGWIDAALMRMTDVALAFPRIVLALAIVAGMGPGLEHAILAIALTGWPPYARLARAETLTHRRSDYIAAVRLLGASPLRIVLVHIVPLCLPSLTVRATLDMAGVILLAAGLGFLGLGAQAPLAEWGAMLSSGRGYLLTAWWVATIPGLAIFAASMGFNLVGDGLRDVLDPRQNG